MTIRFYCQNCGKPLEVDDRDADRPVICYYCKNQMIAPTAGDPSIPAALESAEIKPSPSMGRIGLALALVLVALTAVFVIWTVVQVRPTFQDPNYAKLSEQGQAKAVNQKFNELFREHPIIVYGYRTLLIILTLTGFGLSYVGYTRNRGKGPALVGLIICGFFLLVLIYAVFRLISSFFSSHAALYIFA